MKRITGGYGAHSAVVTTASPSGYTQAVDYLRPGGTLMAVGLPGKAGLQASIFFTVFKSISILGSYVGNRQDAYEALDIAARGGVVCKYVLKDLPALTRSVSRHSFSSSLCLLPPSAPTTPCKRARSPAVSSSSSS